MLRRSKFLIAALVLALGGVSYGASVVTGSNAFIHANVVAACGTPNSTYAATDSQALTMDTSGVLCLGASSAHGANPATANATAALAERDDTSTFACPEDKLCEQRLTDQRALVTSLLPSGTLADPITTVTSTAIENGHVLKASAGRLQDVYVVNTDTVTNYLMIVAVNSIPVDGAIFTQECIPVAAGQAASITYGVGLAESFSAGITAVLSSTSCGTITKVVKGYFHGRVL